MGRVSAFQAEGLIARLPDSASVYLEQSERRVK